MVTKELVKVEIDKVADEYLVPLYKIIKAFESHALDDLKKYNTKDSGWHQFINETYGCLASDPIERGDQGGYEMREENADG